MADEFDGFNSIKKRRTLKKTSYDGTMQMLFLDFCCVSEINQIFFSGWQSWGHFQESLPKNKTFSKTESSYFGSGLTIRLNFVPQILTV